jgi:hypothetical protein
MTTELRGLRRARLRRRCRPGKQQHHPLICGWRARDRGQYAAGAIVPRGWVSSVSRCEGRECREDEDHGELRAGRRKFPGKPRRVHGHVLFREVQPGWPDFQECPAGGCGWERERREVPRELQARGAHGPFHSFFQGGLAEESPGIVATAAAGTAGSLSFRRLRVRNLALVSRVRMFVPSVGFELSVSALKWRSSNRALSTRVAQ